MEALCVFNSAVQKAATWGEAEDQAQTAIDWIEKNEPPEELREFFEASMALTRLEVRFIEENRSLSFAEHDAWYDTEDPEINEALQTLGRVAESLDAAVIEAFEALNEC